MRRRVCAQRFIAYLCCFLLNVPVLAQAHTIGPNGPIPVERAPLRLPVPESNPAPAPAAEPEYSPAESSTTARYNKEIYYIHADHLNTPRAITNGEQRKVWQWGNTDPFGKNAADENPERQGGFAFNLRFPGQYYDRETGLHYNWHRDYDPGVGRYVQSDPIGLMGGVGIYSYAIGNPLNHFDVTGTVVWDGDMYNLQGGIGIWGGGMYWFDLKSQCVNGMYAYIRVGAFAGSLGVNFIPIRATGGYQKVRFNDGISEIQPYRFEGIFAIASLGIGAILTGGWNAIKLGQNLAEVSTLAPSPGIGIDASASAGIGFSKVVSVAYKCCRY